MASRYGNQGEHESAGNVCVWRKIEAHNLCAVERDDVLGGGLSNRGHCVARKNPERWKRSLEILAGLDLGHCAPRSFEKEGNKRRSPYGPRPGAVRRALEEQAA